MHELTVCGVNVTAVVNCCCEVVNYFHQAPCIMAQVEMLLWAIIDVPLELLKILLFFAPQQLKIEMESHFALATCFCILVVPQLHDFEVI